MTAETARRVQADVLRQRAFRLLQAAGVRDDVAEATADGLVWTSTRGIDSHGIRLLPHYLASVRSGRLNPSPSMVFERTGSATGCLDADHTFGHAAGREGMRRAIGLAHEAGVGAVTVRNSSHCGALSFFGHQAAEEGMLGMVFTHATPRVRTPGSVRPFFGNNPLCLVAPMRDEEPFCFDAATTGITFNAVRARAEEGRTVPPGLVADIEGRETTDPTRAAQLLPIGDYKGFGLSMLVDVLCAVLTGMPSGNRVSQMFGATLSGRRHLGHFFCAIRIEGFRNLDGFMNELQELADRVRAEPALDGTRRPMVPGDPEKRAWAERVRLGIPMPNALAAELAELEKLYHS